MGPDWPPRGPVPTASVSSTITRSFEKGPDSDFTETSVCGRDAADRVYIRRYTTLEKTRLFGYPDEFFAAVRYAGRRPPSDTAITRGLGNSVMVPVAEWIAARIDAIAGTREQER